MTVQELGTALAGGTPPALLDVRSRAEFAESHVEGAVNVPFWRFFVSWPRVPVGRDDRLVVYCGEGPRARLAMAVLRRRGYRRVEELEGHMAAWRTRGRAPRS